VRKRRSSWSIATTSDASAFRDIAFIPKEQPPPVPAKDNIRPKGKDLGAIMTGTISPDGSSTRPSGEGSKEGIIREPLSDLGQQPTQRKPTVAEKEAAWYPGANDGLTDIDLENGGTLNKRNSGNSHLNGPPDTRDGTFGEDDEGSEPDPNAWGPTHPCYPHLNPHVPKSSPLYESTRIIKIERDWMIVGDEAPTFSEMYPEILAGYLEEDEFRSIVGHVNKELIETFRPWSARNVLDSVLGVLTFFLWEDVGATGAKRRMKKLDEWLEDWNARNGKQNGVSLIGLRKTGYLNVS
jgi:Golgin subfamily A member 7/ERF4 family